MELDLLLKISSRLVTFSPSINKTRERTKQNRMKLSVPTMPLAARLLGMLAQLYWHGTKAELTEAEC